MAYPRAIAGKHAIPGKHIVVTNEVIATLQNKQVAIFISLIFVIPA
jgi:hypothetical protein